MTCSPGDLVLIPFPFSDLPASKRRPVLVLTTPDRHGDFIALAVTSVEQLDIALEINAAAIAAGALPRRSWVRLDKLFTLGEGNVIKSFGAVKSEFFDSVLDGLCKRVGYSKS